MSETLEVGQIYTREQLRDMFGIGDATINTGVFRPKGHDSVWLFVTEQKSSDRTPYFDHLDGDTLYWDGQSKGKTDDIIINHKKEGLDLVLFYRRSRFEHPGAGFRYEGRFEYVSCEGGLPAHFVLRRIGTAEESESYTVNFVADVHLIQILGEQLIGSEKVGILELIKNSYDAGASICHVWIEKVPGMPDAELSDPQIAGLQGPVITVIDDGCGMNKETIENGWMRPATRIKTAVKEQLKRERAEADRRGTRSEYEALVRTLKREYGGRIPLGEKGVGRFATHRLGRHLILQTKTKTESFEWVLEVDWDEFDAPDDEPRDLQDVDLQLIHRPPRHNYGPTGAGTLLRVYGGREGFEWTEEKLLEIGQAIAHLRSPAKGSPMGFDVVLHCPQLPGGKFEALTETVPAPFECTAIVDEEGKAEIELRFSPPQSLSKPMSIQPWSATLDLREKPPADIDMDYWRQAGAGSPLRLPDCGPFAVEIKVWLRVKEWIDYADWREFTDYLDDFGGIGVYRDGLGILAAQKASRDDWLRLSTRHIKKGENISYYQMSGSVDLLQEYTLNLVDRTSREGLLETRSFVDLSVLVRTIVFLLEFYVKETRNSYEALRPHRRIPDAALEARAEAASKVLQVLSSEYDFEADPVGIRGVIEEEEEPAQAVSLLAESVEEIKEELRDLRTQSDALLEAAGYGIAIGVAVHEIEKITANLYYGLEQLAGEVSPISQGPYTRTKRLGQTAKSLLNELKRLAPLRVTRLEPRTKFGVRDCILAASGAFRLAWEELGISFYPPSKSDDFEIEGSFGACSQVFANLFDNATYWLRASAKKGQRIMVRMDPVERSVVVADSGPGIDEKMRPHLFEPFYSLKNPPSGLGLYICMYYMRQMRGTLRESFEKERLPGFPGAHFTLVFAGEDKAR